MANLPPRPESPPKLRDDRRALDDRDRDRRAAVPMAPVRPARPLPERERVYVPSRTDTYIPGGYDSRRENDRRDHDNRDRDRDRFRESDRDRDRDRRRDFDRSPRRRESDRDRHERDRGSYRRPVSPLRRYGSGPVRRDSRSPPRRRTYRSHSRSRTPSRRSRPRSRSPSPRHSPSKRLKLGNHPTGDGTRSRSPHKRSRSRGRSKSVEKGYSTLAVPPSDSQEKPNTSSEVAIIEQERIGVKVPEETTTMTTEYKIDELPSSIAYSAQQPLHSSIQEENKNSLPQKPSHPESNDAIPQPSIEIKVEIPDSTSPHSHSLVDSKKQVIKIDTTEDVQVKKMDVDSPRLTPVNSTNPTRSPSPHSSRSTYDPQRSNVPTGPQRSWPNRSPPRGPRLHPRSNIPPPNQLPPYPSGRRDSRRAFPIPGQTPFQTKIDELKVPQIPKYEKTKGWESEISALELELSKQRPVRLAHAHQDINHVQSLQRALHELHMASIDLHAAEGRRRVADLQLDKAKTGSLGIDALELVETYSPTDFTR